MCVHYGRVREGVCALWESEGGGCVHHGRVREGDVYECVCECIDCVHCQGNLMVELPW